MGLDYAPAQTLKLTKPDRMRIWQALAQGIEGYLDDVSDLPAGSPVSTSDVEAALDAFDFDTPTDPVTAVENALDALRRLQPHVRHPRHFGLFDAAPTTMGVVGETLTAAFNPCLASWAGSPFGVAAEHRLVMEFGQRFGFRSPEIDGVITSGGSEANLSALLLALTARYPDHHVSGVRGLERAPTVYLTGEAHPSMAKATTLAGLGSESVRRVPVDGSLRMDPAALETRVRADRDAGLAPLLVTATVGTTGAGVVDPLARVAEIADRHGLWLHVDAAWGGAAALLPELASHFAGIERADSLTFDPHKWMSVPIGAGLLLTRRPGLLQQTFHVGPSFLSEEDQDTLDPLMRSLRWSRSFSGLKILLSLAAAGWGGYQEVWRRQIGLAERLRESLGRSGWRVINTTVLPVVCFQDAADSQNGVASTDFLDLVARLVNSSGQAKIFRVTVGGKPALRVCVTNYDTTENDVDLLVELVDFARTAIRRHGPAAAPAPRAALATCETRCAP